MLVLAVLFLIAAAVAVVASFSLRKPTQVRPRLYTRIAGVVGVVIAAIFVAVSSAFTLDPGQAAVLKNWTGDVSPTAVTEAGLHFKSPLESAVIFDVRNQRVVYAGASGDGSDNTGGTADGAQITVQDADGVSSNIDIAVRYSLDGADVVNIYKQYLNEDNLKTKLIFNDIRSITRSVPGSYSTLDLLTKRDEIQAAIDEKLKAKWVDDGIIVDDVALQEIRVPDSVKESYAAAQQAQIEVTKEQAKLDAVKISSQQEVVKAQAAADANDLLTKSLSPEILQNKYLEALKTGTVYVVPEGSTPFISTEKSATGAN